MELTQSTSMRMEQRQLLTPRMIQSMEILQLPLMLLEERIEQEMQSNPVLEMRDGDGENNGEATPASETNEQTENTSEGEQALVVKENNDAERDKKLDAMNNTAARGVTLAEHLLNQWAFIEAPLGVKQAGEAIINYI